MILQWAVALPCGDGLHLKSTSPCGFGFDDNIWNYYGQLDWRHQLGFDQTATSETSFTWTSPTGTTQHLRRLDPECWNTVNLDHGHSDHRQSTSTISMRRTSTPRSTHQIFGTIFSMVNSLSSSTSWFIWQPSRCSLVKPVVTVQPESCFLGSVNWCWSGISSQIPRMEYSCCESHLSFDSSRLPHRVTVELRVSIGLLPVCASLGQALRTFD